MHCTQLLKAYGTVVRIRLVYNKDFPSNRCYVTFMSCDEDRLAYEHVASLPLTGSGFKTEFLLSRNISDSDLDYIPNVFESYLEISVPKVHHIPPPRWFVAYYRNGCGNFIHASRYLSKEIGTIPEENLKKYGKGVLVRAKDITQARMLQHLSCPTERMFETVKAHPTFNYSKGCVYSQDLYEFLEEEILAMCPSSVLRLMTKMRNSSNMVLLTFFASTLPERVHIGPINLRLSLPVRRQLLLLANRFALFSEDSVESSLRSDEKNTDLTKVTHVVDVHLPPVSPKPLKGLAKRHRSSAESIDLVQSKQS
ncbi:hypothetical protein E2C01_018416 [Portunus trituberculatus]|uniref:RRM domain-containing protein n=1 Tax=Portunus trituberculatus TaxID=210409 RepID=A0A5B7DV03_PORTR|nr:hypothetical protein [Portunus trituberculatus]